MPNPEPYIRSSSRDDGTDPFFESHGIDVTRLRAEFGLRHEDQVPNQTVVPWDSVCNLYERGAEEAGEPHLGLKFALQSNFKNISQFFYIATFVTDLRALLDITARYLYNHTNGIRLIMFDEREKDELCGVYTVHPLSGPYRQMLELMMVQTVVMGRSFVPDFEVKYVSFQRRSPEDTTIYEEAFNAPVHFDSAENKIAISLKFGDVKLSNFSGRLLAYTSKTFFDWQARSNPDARRKVSALITETMPTIMGTSGTSFGAVAKSMNMHPKKLQRLLADEGASFSKILDDVRRSIASRLLRDTDIPILRVAKMLDYSSDRAFATAFKRWFGIAPSTYREQIRAAEVSPVVVF